MRRSCLFCRIVAGEMPVDPGPRGRPRHRDPRHRPARPDPHPADPAARTSPRRPTSTEADGPLLGRLFAVAAEIARAEGIADGGYRIVTNVGAWGGQTVDHLHVHLMGGRPFDWPPG